VSTAATTQIPCRNYCGNHYFYGACQISILPNYMVIFPCLVEIAGGKNLVFSRHALYNNMRAYFLIIAMIVSTIAVVALYYAPGLELISRSDGEFVPFMPPPQQTINAFYKKHNLKPVKMRFITTTPYKITVRIDASIYTLTVPANYITDGVTSPIRNSLILNEYEDSYWVYHDYMYYVQQFDDGTPITKCQSDDIMHRIIVYNKHAPPWCRLYRLFVNCNYNKQYWCKRYNTGPCFYIRPGVVVFPRCNKELLY
jgi:hypothetical protein